MAAARSHSSQSSHRYSNNEDVSQQRHAARARFPMRSVEINALQRNGSHISSQLTIPALPIFDGAFSAFTHGSVFQTDQGWIPVEDLQPGDMVQTAEGGQEKIVWIGSATYAPSEAGHRSLLVRLTPDAFGVAMPSNSLTLGSAARVLKTPARLRGVMDGMPLLTPVGQFEDGNAIAQISPPTPIRLFHLCLKRHSVLNVGGLAVESYHPGTTALGEVTPQLREQFLGMFPHVERLADFGPMAHDHAPDIQELIG